MDAVILCGYSIPKLSSKPAGAFVIANIFREKGFECQVIDFLFVYSSEDRAKIFQKYLTKDTKFICFSTTLAGLPGNQYVYLHELDKMFEPIMQEAKEYAPNAIWIVGGQKVLRENSSLPFDYSVRGQGEQCLESILDYVTNGSDLKVFEVSENTKVISDSDYPCGNFNDRTALKFHERDFVEYQETLPLEISRGCVFKCTYCDYYLTGKKFGDFSKREDLVYDAMLHNYEKFGVTRYIITDDTLNDTIEKAHMMLRISKRLPFKLEYGGSMRIELFYKHPEMAEIFLESGMVATSFGIETFNKKSGAVVGKGFGDKAKDVLLDLEKVWRGKVAVSMNLILGLPYETKEMLQESFDWVANTSAVDSLLCHPFYIWRVKNSDTILNSAELFGYYKDTKKGDNPRYIDWVSKDNSFEDVKILAEFYRKEFARRKGHMLGTSANSFITMMAMQKYTIEEQRQIPTEETSKIFQEIVKNRIIKFKYNLLNN
jgi:hypothetical protein